MNKVTISNRPEPVFQGDTEWKEYIIKKEDLNNTVLSLIYEREDVQFVTDYLEKHFKHDKRRKNVWFYVNKDIVGLKNFMQYLNTEQDSSDILE
jgi:hypothetical protein